MTSVKGLFKGLRCIAQIFEQQKEPEMQIGLPTDVKHVGHIGWDGPSATDPSWMSVFKSGPENTNQPSNSVQESKKPGKYLESATQDTKPRSTTTDKPKHKSRRKSGESSLDSPTKRRSDGSKQSMRSVDSPRGMNKSKLGDDPAGVPKSSRRKKTKATEGTKADTAGQRMKNKEIKLSSSVVATNEEQRG